MATSPQEMPSGESGRYGVTLQELLQTPSLSKARVVAGAAGLSRMVARLNVMEVPDIQAWVKPDELLLTTGYPLREHPQTTSTLIEDLDARGLAGIAIKVGRYLTGIPADMLAQAERLGFPIIELPDQVGFDDILNECLSVILERHVATLERSDEVHRALVGIVLEGGGLPELVVEVTRLIDGFVIVTTPDGRILAKAGESALAPDSAFDATGRLIVEHQRYGAQEVHYEDGASAFVAAAPIVAAQGEQGRIAVFGIQALTPIDVTILERSATVAALALTKRQAIAAVESKYQGDFLRDLLAGRAGGAEQTLPYSKALGWDLNRSLLLVVAELDPENGLTANELRTAADRFTLAWESVVRARDPRAAVVGFSSEVVALLGSTEGVAPLTALNEIAAAVTGDGGGGRRKFTAGVSRIVDGPDELPAAYEQARQAVRVGRQVHGPGRVADFDSLGVFRILSLVPDSTELRSFLGETLGELATRIDPEAADLRRTLQALLDTNLNVAETSRLLHFHYNTLRYRIGKLERMLGPFTTDAHLRLSLSLALRILTMRGI
jgi:DNA-binding PucR family transcriptional regulator